jgi:hypothetical protein
MTERLSPRSGSLRRKARRSAPQPRGTRGRGKNLPPPPPSYVAAVDPPEGESTILGFPAESDADDVDDVDDVEAGR